MPMKQKAVSHVRVQEIRAMLIYVLALAMTVAMLIATMIGLYQETDRLRFQERTARTRGFGSNRRIH